MLFPLFGLNNQTVTTQGKYNHYNYLNLKRTLHIKGLKIKLWMVKIRVVKKILKKNNLCTPVYRQVKKYLTEMSKFLHIITWGEF